jgi:hypothetical protein
MDIQIEIPAGKGLEPGVRVKVRINGGEPQKSVVQPATYRSGADLSGRFELPSPQ